MTTLCIMAEASCSHRCWYAQGNVCRCSCEGANHGLLKDSGAAPPRAVMTGGKNYQFTIFPAAPAAEQHGRTPGIKAQRERGPGRDQRPPGVQSPSATIQQPRTEQDNEERLLNGSSPRNRGHTKPR